MLQTQLMHITKIVKTIRKGVNLRLKKMLMGNCQN